jgi:AcrR family transcriptional regulator
MARLTNEDLEKNRRLINKVAVRCFSSSGFNGITMREIAKKAKIPLGSLYNYYEDKLDLFEAIITEQSRVFLSPDNEVIRYFLSSKFPDDLPLLAEAMKESVKTYESYFKLMYVDVVEFNGAHIKEVFSNLDEKFRQVMEKRFKELGLMGEKKIDPAFALTTIYLSFYQYFILTKLFGATKIFGKKTDQQVIEGMINILFYGIKKEAH